MAQNPLEAVKGLSPKVSPYKVPGTTPITGSKQIPSHPFYRYPMHKATTKEEFGTGLHRGFDKQAWDPQSGLTEAQWDAVVYGGRGGQDTLEQMGAGSWDESLGGTEGYIDPQTGTFTSRTPYGTTSGSTYDLTGKHGGVGASAKKGHDWWGKTYERGRYGIPSWAEGWYEPARRVSVEEPLEAMGATTGPHAEFIQTSGLGLPQQDSPFDLGIGAEERIQSGVVPNLMGISDAGEAAREEYLGITEELYGTGGATEQLEEERLKGEQELKAQREDIIAGRAPSFETSQAARAQTGMAYSAPTERAIAFGREGETKALADVTRSERQLGTDYERGQEDILGAQEEAYEKYAGPGGALGDFWQDVMNIFGEGESGAQRKASDAVQRGYDILGNWGEFGTPFGIIKGGFGTGVLPTGGGFFGEQFAGGYDPMDEYKAIGDAAEITAQNVYQRALERKGQLSGALPSELAGQIGGV